MASKVPGVQSERYHGDSEGMSAVIASNSWNGESGKHLAISGTDDDRECVMTIGDNWSTLRFLLRFLMSGPESNPSGPVPYVFIGVCEDGKPYFDAAANACGLVIGDTGVTFQYVAGQDRWTTWMRGRKKVAAVVTDSTGNTCSIPRSENALSSVMFGFEMIKGTPNWTYNKLVLADTAPPDHTNVTADGQAFHKVASEARALTGYRDFAHKTFGNSYLSSVNGHTIAAPSGTFDSICLAWTFPTSFGGVIQDLIVSRVDK